MRGRRLEAARVLGADVRGSEGAGGPREGGRSHWPGKSPNVEQ